MVLHHPLKIFILGPQGSGKGTQGELLSDRLQLPVLSMGQLLRDEVAQKSVIGQEMEEILRRGDLVPNQMAATVLHARLSKPDIEHGYILDGYPRDMNQYEVFTFDRPTHVFVLEIPLDVSLSRLAGRLTCNTCGKVSNISQGYAIGDMCSTCKTGHFIHRDDDTDEAIRRRLAIYHKETEEVIRALETQGLVHHVDGIGSVEEVDDRIITILNSSIPKK